MSDNNYVYDTRPVTRHKTSYATLRSMNMTYQLNLCAVIDLTFTRSKIHWGFQQNNILLEQ